MHLKSRTLTFTINLNPDAYCESCGQQIFSFEEKLGFGNGTGVCKRCATERLTPEELTVMRLQNKR